MSTALHNPVEILPGRLVCDEAGVVTGREPSEPCPALLTADEVSRFMRLDDLKDPSAVLYELRRRGHLRGTQVGRHIRYLRAEVMRCLEQLTEEKPR